MGKNFRWGIENTTEMQNLIKKGFGAKDVGELIRHDYSKGAFDFDALHFEESPFEFEELPTQDKITNKFKQEKGKLKQSKEFSKKEFHKPETINENFLKDLEGFAVLISAVKCFPDKLLPR